MSTDTNPFKVPDNYFDKLSNRVIEKIESTDRENVRLMTAIKPYLWMAASIVILVVFATQLFSYIITQQAQTEKNNTTINLTASLEEIEFSEEDILDYLDEDNFLDEESILSEL